MARCWLVYALAPEGMSARAANDALNEYISDVSRGIPVLHDHFTGKPHGGFVVLFPRDDGEEARLGDPGPLDGWDVHSHPLVFALTPVGLDAQLDFTLEEYGRTSLTLLREAEPADPRYWWQRRAGPGGG
jgi:hypothetical protein